MRKIPWLASIMVWVLMASACQPGNTDLPTLVPVAVTTEPTATPAIAVSATEIATRFVRPTLPPAFTATPSPSETPTATETLAVSTPFVSNATPDVACNTFDAIFEQSTTQFEIGTSPTIAWTPVVGAELYRLIIKESFGRVVQDNIYIKETSYMIPQDYFNVGKSYGWEVYPINSSGDQMCFAVGLELIPVEKLAIPATVTPAS